MCGFFNRADCVNGMGTFTSKGVTCEQHSCEGTASTGACCLGSGDCANTNGPDCSSLGGMFNAPGTECATTTCP